MRYFPLFADLHGRRVLVVGGGEVAERKVRLLLEAGARIDLVARELTPWLAARAAASGGEITLRAAEFESAQLVGVVLVGCRHQRSRGQCARLRRGRRARRPRQRGR